jgi:hypothetical protein
MTNQDTPELPGIAPEKVKITDPLHIYMMGFGQGQMHMVEALEGVAKPLQQTPGFALALATASAEMNKNRADAVSRNLATVAKAGINIAHHKAVRFDPMTGELLVEFYHPDDAT